MLIQQEQNNAKGKYWQSMPQYPLLSQTNQNDSSQLVGFEPTLPEGI